MNAHDFSIAISFLAIGLVAGMLLAAIAGARRRGKLEDELRVLRGELASCQRTIDHLQPKPIPMNDIRSLVADCSNKTVAEAGQVLEVLVAFPEIASALRNYRKPLSDLADPHAARTYATHGIHEAREILRRERGGR